MGRPQILVTNDDGVHAHGISCLHSSLKDCGDVVVVAPMTERSGTSQALTLDRPLRMQKLGGARYAVDGTPADCVLFAIAHLFERAPDLVISGINHGANVGQDTCYSGTVGAALEASLQDVPAIAVSLANYGRDPEEGMKTAQEVVRMVVVDGGLTELRFREMARGYVLNINIPNRPLRELRGVRTASLGRRIYDSRFYQKTDPRGKNYFWLGGGGADSVEIQGSDCRLLDDGWVTVTMLQPSMYAQDATHRFDKEVMANVSRQFGGIRGITE